MSSPPRSVQLVRRLCRHDVCHWRSSSATTKQHPTKVTTMNKIILLAVLATIAATTMAGDYPRDHDKFAAYKERKAERRRIALVKRRNLYGGKKYNNIPNINFGSPHRYVSLSSLLNPYRPQSSCRPKRRSSLGYYAH